MALTLAAIDLSETSPAVCEASCREGGAILLLHVAPMDPEYVTLRVGPKQERDWIARQLLEAREQLQHLGAQLQATGRDVETLVVQGDAADRVLEEALRRHADLIVVGRHRHGRLHDRLVGTVAESLIRRATVPVLVVPLTG